MSRIVWIAIMSFLAALTINGYIDHTFVHPLAALWVAIMSIMAALWNIAMSITIAALHIHHQLQHHHEEQARRKAVVEV